MAAKQIAYDIDARERMLRGIQKLAKAVKVTLSPSGRVVVLEKSFCAPTVTKDGMTVAKEIELGDAFENMVAQMVKEVASQSSKDAGDGTTTETVYAEAIFTEGLKNITAGANANEINADLLRHLIGGGNAAEGDHPMDLATAERRHIERVLRYVGGNKSSASKILGVDRRTLQRKGF